MRRRSIITTIGVVVVVHVLATTAYLAGTDRLQAFLTALTPVYTGAPSPEFVEGGYNPPTPIKINKFTPSIVAPAPPDEDKVEIFSWVDESGLRRFSQSGIQD